MIKFIPLFLSSIVLLSGSPISANFSDTPELVEASAKYAKLRAKLRSVEATDVHTATTVEHEADGTVTQHLQGDASGGGCDLNVGNVLIDDNVRNTPDEVIIFIEGDIIQSNHCR